MENKVSIQTVKNEYKTICELGIMDYALEIEALNGFSEKYSTDERSGVKSIIKSADKRRAQLEAEIERVKGMTSFELKYSDEYDYICGVDEVGRGPLAGPVVTAAVILPKGLIIPYLNDSKQVNEKRREELYDIIMENAISVCVGSRSEKEIDSMGIAVADSAAMRDSVLRPALLPMNFTMSLMFAKLFLHTLAMTFPPTIRVAKTWSLIDKEVLLLFIILSSMFLFTLQRYRAIVPKYGPSKINEVKSM